MNSYNARVLLTYAIESDIIENMKRELVTNFERKKKKTEKN